MELLRLSRTRRKDDQLRDSPRDPGGFNVAAADSTLIHLTSGVHRRVIMEIRSNYASQLNLIAANYPPLDPVLRTASRHIIGAFTTTYKSISRARARPRPAPERRAWPK